MHHFLRDQNFLIKVPPSWRGLHARGRKLEAEGVACGAVARKLGVVARRLGVDERRWGEIVQACSVGVWCHWGRSSRSEPPCPGTGPGEMIWIGDSLRS